VPTFRNTLSVPSDGTECFDTSAHEIQTTGNHPKNKHSKQDEVGNRECVNVILLLTFKNSPNVLTLCVSGRTFPICSP
jgi:hypothetical protein